MKHSNNNVNKMYVIIGLYIYNRVLLHEILIFNCFIVAKKTKWNPFNT
jgi:hypothetical protein